MKCVDVDYKAAFDAKVVSVGDAAWGALCRAAAWTRTNRSKVIPHAVALSIAPQPSWHRLEAAGLVGAAPLGYAVTTGLIRFAGSDSTSDWDKSAYPEVYARDGRVCRYCGDKIGPHSIDHVIPRCMGGNDLPRNLVVSCAMCNSKKGGRTPEQAGMSLLSAPRST